MKLIIKFAVIILVNLLINSCIQEQRVYPKQPAQGTTSNNTSNNSSSSSSNNTNSSNTNSSSSNSNNSTSNAIKINYVNYLDYNFSEVVDSNSNKYFVSFRLNLNFKTNFGSKVKYGIYASTSSSSYYSSYTLLYQSPLIDNISNDAINYSRKFNTDSIFNLTPLKNNLSNQNKSSLYLYVVVQDSANNNYTYQVSQSSYVTYSSQPNYILMDDQNFWGLEKLSSDLSYTVNLTQFQYPTNTSDVNSNGLIQPPTKFKSFYYSSAKNKSVYFKIYYSSTPSTSNSYILYGTTTSYNLPIVSSSAGFDIDIINPLVNITTGSYYFQIEIYDFRSNVLLDTDYLYTRNGSSVIQTESLSEDQRIFTLGFVKFIKNEDNDNDSFPSTYYLKLKINSSDNIFPTTSSLNLNIATYATTSYQTMLTRSDLRFSDTVMVLVSGGTGYAKSYYDFRLNVSFNNRTVLSTDASQNANLREIKLERTTED